MAQMHQHILHQLFGVGQLIALIGYEVLDYLVCVELFLLQDSFQ